MIEDIKGTKCKKKIKEKELIKTNNVSDIEFAKPAKEKVPTQLRDIMKVDDINNKKNI